MKNCLIVVVVLIGCFFVAAYLIFGTNGSYGSGMASPQIAEWRDYEDAGMHGVTVSIFPNEIIVGIPVIGVGREIREKGHWNLHAFYCDSHVDSPAEVEVAHETKDEALVVDIGRFIPSHPQKITLAKWVRGLSDAHPGYPVSTGHDKVAYPPPKGLIRVGMLQCDLDALPWHSDEVDIQNDGGDENSSRISFAGGPPPELGNSDENPQIYNYHSDRDGVPKLFVTVYHGRVTEVTGGAEETTDIPYQLPAATPATDVPPVPPSRTWAEWLFNLIFAK